MDQSIFRAYDVRGIYPKQINEDVVFSIGQGFVSLLQAEHPGKKIFNIVVGRDMRLSSPSLEKSLIKGVTAAGANVINIEQASTPTFYYAVARFGYDGGLIVSASHNPKEYNGVKLVRARAAAFGLEDGLDKIRDFCARGEKITAPLPGKTIRREGVLADCVKESVSFYDFSGIKPLKIVADTANAMGGLDLAELTRHLPIKLEKLNFKLDGNFPAHQADPFKDENVKDLKAHVIKHQADLGIATDGDADRIFFIDEKGEMIEPAIIRGIMAQVVLRHNPGAKVGYDIRPGMITREMIEKNGGQPFVTRVGHSLIKKKSLEENAVFSGESSGHFFFKTKYGFYETPLIVALVMLDELSKSGKKASEWVAPLRKYFHSGEINSEVANKAEKMKELEKIFGAGAKNVSWLDGVTIEHDDWWFNVRASNTEPLLRLNLEAKTKAVMEQKKDEVLRVIRN